MRVSSILSVVVVACGGSSTAPTSPSTPTESPSPGDEVVADLMLTTDDGFRLATTYEAGGPEAVGAVVLVHQLSSTRAEWAPVIEALGGRHHVLSFDLRGHGGSTRRVDGTERSWRDFLPEDWAAGVADLEAARAFLEGLGLGTSDTVYIGSSIGSTQVLRHVGKYVDAAGVVLLSPGLRYRDLDVVPAAKRFGGPGLLVASGEAGPADAVGVLQGVWGKDAGGATAEVHTSPGTAHGMKMAADDAALVPAIAAFVDAALAAR